MQEFKMSDGGGDRTNSLKEVEHGPVTTHLTKLLFLVGSYPHFHNYHLHSYEVYLYNFFQK